ncbi:MAG: hypothetical protein K6U89_12635 [Chloroflexi bacterium]|nr:hypothetical protein [Chloroflexota bacterium]
MAGALPEAGLLATLRAAGFRDATILARHDIFAPGGRGPGATRYGAYGVSFRARRA